MAMNATLRTLMPLPRASYLGRSALPKLAEARQAAEYGRDLRLHAVDASAWNNLLTEFDDVSFDQCAPFAAGRWGDERLSYLVVRRGSDPIGGACVVRFAIPLLPGGVAVVKHGPIWRRKGREPNPGDYRAIVSELIAEYGQRLGHGLVVVPRPHPTVLPLEAGILTELGFVVRRPSADPNRFLVDASLDEATQQQSLGQKWRYNLRNAVKNGVEVSEATNAEGFRLFAGLHSAMVSRKRFADRDPVHTIPDMISGLPDALRPRIFMAYHRRAAVAGAVVGVHADTAYYLFGATNEQALSLNAGYALHWSILCWLRSQSARWYDLGGEAGDHGLRQFKKGLVGKRGAIVNMPGEFEYAGGVGAQFSLELVMAIRAMRRSSWPFSWPSLRLDK